MTAASATFLTIPLELRHRIIGFASWRKEGSKQVIRRWYERLEAGQLGAPRTQATTNSTAATEREDDEGDEQDDEQDNEEDNAQDGNDSSNARAAYSAAVVGKWRHVPNIMRITQCPPPINLLLTCKQLHEESMDYYYDVMALQINATASFAHQTYFEEEVFDKLCNAAFSPLENIRRLEVNFVWDSKWIKSDPRIIFEVWEYELLSRAGKIAQLMRATPELQKVNVLWCDTATTPEAFALENQVVEILEEVQNEKPRLKIELKVVREEDDDAVQEHTLMGKQREEFQSILDGGQNFR